MADFANELADYLATQGVGTVATNIFVVKLPATPDNCIALFGLPGQVIGDQREVASLHFPRVQIITRNTSYENASDKLEAVRTALHNKYGLDFASWRVMRLHAEQEGGSIGQDDQGRYEFSINFVAETNAE
jgi:hypothetical protein